MKKYLLRVLSVLVLSQAVSGVSAQQRVQTLPAATHLSTGHAKFISNRAQSEAGTKSLYKALTSNSLPLVVLPDADKMPVSGRLHQQQGNGRALHNIQVDPDHPQNVHAVIMQLSSEDKTDGNLVSRRVYYTFSSDGGRNWKTPVALVGKKTGFPHMVLYKRGGNWVPVIAAHVGLAADGTNIESALWVEKGLPGEGNFEMTECGRNDQTGGGDKDIIWPCIGVSPAGDKVYMVGSVSPGTGAADEFLHYGTFDLDPSGKATWNGWTQLIGDKDPNNSFAGQVSSGDYILRVSPEGKVGLLWRSTDYATPAANLYYIESADGTTWPTDMNVFFAAQESTTSAGTWGGPWTFFDLYYPSESPTIMFVETTELFDPDANGNPSNSYYPSQMRLHLYNGDTKTDQVLLTTYSTDPDAQFSVTDLVAAYPVGSSIKEATGWIGYPTLAHGSDPNYLQVFYQLYPATDTVFFTEDTVKMYASIYTQRSSDAGATWTEPTAFRSNPETATGYGKIDYRYPQVSEWNEMGANGLKSTVMFAADTAAGEGYVTNGAQDWDVVDFFHQSSEVNSVHASGTVQSFALKQNFPNPVSPKTSIGFELNQASNVVLTVQDMLGRPVATVLNSRLAAGPHSVEFNASTLPAGTYSYTLTANGESVTRLMSVVK